MAEGSVTVITAELLAEDPEIRTSYPVVLDLSAPRFCIGGSVADSLSLIRCDVLRSLNVDSNGLRSLEGIERFTALRSLSARHNILAAAMPRCARLKELYLSSNRLRVLPVLAGCPDLRSLEVDANQISGGYEQMRYAPKLARLILRSNQVGANGQTELTDLGRALRAATRLTCLDLDNNPISKLQQVLGTQSPTAWLASVAPRACGSKAVPSHQSSPGSLTGATAAIHSNHLPSVSASLQPLPQHVVLPPSMPRSAARSFVPSPAVLDQLAPQASPSQDSSVGVAHAAQHIGKDHRQSQALAATHDGTSAAISGALDGQTQEAAAFKGGAKSSLSIEDAAHRVAAHVGTGSGSSSKSSLAGAAGGLATVGGASPEAGPEAGGLFGVSLGALSKRRACPPPLLSELDGLLLTHLTTAAKLASALDMAAHPSLGQSISTVAMGLDAQGAHGTLLSVLTPACLGRLPFSEAVPALGIGVLCKLLAELPEPPIPCSSYPHVLGASRGTIGALLRKQLSPVHAALIEALGTLVGRLLLQCEIDIATPSSADSERAAHALLSALTPCVLRPAAGKAIPHAEWAAAVRATRLLLAYHSQRQQYRALAASAGVPAGGTPTGDGTVPSPAAGHAAHSSPAPRAGPHAAFATPLPTSDATAWSSADTDSDVSPASRGANLPSVTPALRPSRVPSASPPVAGAQGAWHGAGAPRPGALAMASVQSAIASMFDREFGKDHRGGGPPVPPQLHPLPQGRGARTLHTVGQLAADNEGSNGSSASAAGATAPVGLDGINGTATVPISFASHAEPHAPRPRGAACPELHMAGDPHSTPGVSSLNGSAGGSVGTASRHHSLSGDSSLDSKTIEAGDAIRDDEGTRGCGTPPTPYQGLLPSWLSVNGLTGIISSASPTTQPDAKLVLAGSQAQDGSRNVGRVQPHPEHATVTAYPATAIGDLTPGVCSRAASIASETWASVDMATESDAGHVRASPEEEGEMLNRATPVAGHSGQPLFDRPAAVLDDESRAPPKMDDEGRLRAAATAAVFVGSMNEAEEQAATAARARDAAVLLCEEVHETCAGCVRKISTDLEETRSVLAAVCDESRAMVQGWAATADADAAWREEHEQRLHAAEERVLQAEACLAVYKEKFGGEDLSTVEDGEGADGSSSARGDTLSKENGNGHGDDIGSKLGIAHLGWREQRDELIDEVARWRRSAEMAREDADGLKRQLEEARAARQAAESLAAKERADSAALVVDLRNELAQKTQDVAAMDAVLNSHKREADCAQAEASASISSLHKESAALRATLEAERHEHAGRLGAAMSEAQSARAAAALASEAIEAAGNREDELSALRAKVCRLQAVMDSLL